MRTNKLVIYAIALLLIFALFAPVVLAGYAQINKAEAALQAGDYPTATESYSQAAALLPWRRDLWEQAGLSAGRAQDYSAAIVLLKRAPKLSEAGWLTLGYSYYSTGEVDSALACFETGARLYSSAPAYAGLATIHRTQKNWPAERSALEKQLQLQDDTYAHYRLGLLLAVFAPEEASPQLLLASAQDVQFDPAVKTLQAALEDASAPSSSARQMVVIGRALGLLQEWDLSLAAFERATGVDPENAEAWAWLGEAQQQTGQDGRTALDRAVSLDETSVSVRALRGLYWERQGKYEEMLDEYSRAAQYEPQNPAWQASIGQAYIKLGDLAAALDAYQRATDLAPDQSVYWRLLAVFCADNGVRLEDVGLPAAEKAVELAPADPLAIDALGFLYFSSGRFANAEKTFLRAIDLAPNYLPAHVHLAMNYLTQGDRPAAYEELVQVRDADQDGPNGQLAQQLLERYFP